MAAIVGQFPQRAQDIPHRAAPSRQQAFNACIIRANIIIRRCRIRSFSRGICNSWFLCNRRTRTSGFSRLRPSLSLKRSIALSNCSKRGRQHSDHRRSTKQRPTLCQSDAPPRCRTLCGQSLNLSSPCQSPNPSNACFGLCACAPTKPKRLCAHLASRPVF